MCTVRFKKKDKYNGVCEVIEISRNTSQCNVRVFGITGRYGSIRYLAYIYCSSLGFEPKIYKVDTMRGDNRM